MLGDSKESPLIGYTYPFPITMADWYLKHGDKEYGPMDSNKLRQLAAQNKIRPTDYIRRGADGKWTLASHAKGLFSDTVSNDPTAPSPINVHSGDANTGFSQSVPPVAPTPNPAFTQTPNIQTPVAPPIAPAIPVAQKAPSTSSSMSFGDGLDFSSNSAPSPSSPQKGKKGKKKVPAAMDKKTILIASIAGGAVLVLILIAVLVFALRSKKDNSANAPETEQTTTQSKEDADNPAKEENAQAEPGVGEEALPNEDEQTEDGNNPDEQPSQPIAIPENVYDSATQSAKVGDMEIKVVSIRQGTEPIVTKGGVEDDSPDRSTIITVSVQNTNPKKTVKFTPWSVSLSSGKKTNISLTDKENTYGFALKPGEYPKNVKKEPKTIYSDDPPVTDVLIFERFVPGAKELFLTLPVPGDPSQTVTFRIDTENVGKSLGAAKPEASAGEDAQPEKNVSPVVSESAPAEEYNPEDDDEYNEVNGVSEAAQKRDQEEADAELKALNLGD